MAFIVEQAGGAATNGQDRILEILPDEVHGRTAIFIGTKTLVEKAQSFLHS